MGSTPWQYEPSAASCPAPVPAVKTSAAQLPPSLFLSILYISHYRHVVSKKNSSRVYKNRACVVCFVSCLPTEAASVSKRKHRPPHHPPNGPSLHWPSRSLCSHHAKQSLCGASWNKPHCAHTQRPHQLPGFANPYDVAALDSFRWPLSSNPSRTTPLWEQTFGASKLLPLCNEPSLLSVSLRYVPLISLARLVSSIALLHHNEPPDPSTAQTCCIPRN